MAPTFLEVKISVYITSYNQKKYISEAIESVLNQTLMPFEIIIVDDCSTDGSQEIIKKYEEKHPKLIRSFFHKQNLGIPKNRNFALKQVKGELVTFLDGDDKFCPKKLELELLTFHNHPEVKIVYSNFCYIDNLGKEIAIWADNNCIPPSNNIFFETYGQDFPRGTPFRSELVDFSCFSNAGTYDERFPVYEDWDLRIRLTKIYKAAYCPHILSKYRVHESGISATNPSLILESMFAVYKKNLPLLEGFSKDKQKLVKNGLYKRFSFLAKRCCFIKSNTLDKRIFACKFFLTSFYYFIKEFRLKHAFVLLVPRWISDLLRKSHIK